MWITRLKSSRENLGVVLAISDKQPKNLDYWGGIRWIYLKKELFPEINVNESKYTRFFSQSWIDYGTVYFTYMNGRLEDFLKYVGS